MNDRTDEVRQSAAQHRDDVAEYEKAERNAKTHARVTRNAAQHHRDAARRSPLGRTGHEAKAAALEAAADRHDAAAARHHGKAAASMRAAEAAER